MGQGGSTTGRKGGDAGMLSAMDCCCSEKEPTSMISVQPRNFQRSPSDAPFDEYEVHHAVEQAKAAIAAGDTHKEDAFALHVALMQDKDKHELLRRLPARNEVIRMMKELQRKVNGLARRELDEFFEGYSAVERKRIERSLDSVAELQKTANKFVATKISSTPGAAHLQYAATIKTNGDGLFEKPKRRPSVDLSPHDVMMVGSPTHHQTQTHTRTQGTPKSGRRPSLTDSPKSPEGGERLISVSGKRGSLNMIDTLGRSGKHNLGRRSSIEDEIITTVDGKLVSGSARRTSFDAASEI